MPLSHTASHLAEFRLAGGKRERGRQTGDEQRKRREDRAPCGCLFECARLHHATRSRSKSLLRFARSQLSPKTGEASMMRRVEINQFYRSGNLLSIDAVY